MFFISFTKRNNIEPSFLLWRLLLVKWGPFFNERICSFGSKFSLRREEPFSVLPRLHFCTVAQILNMTQPNLSPWDIWRTLIFGPSQTVSCVGNSYAKNNSVFHQSSCSCNNCFDRCIGFRNCTGISIQWQYILIIIMKTGTGKFASFRWTNENLLTCIAASSRCQTERTRNQQNYLRIFVAQAMETKGSQASEADACLPLPALIVWLCQTWLCT